MIARLEGVLRAKSPTEIVIEVHGISFSLHIPLSTYEHLGPLDGPAAVFTYLHVRQDLLQLYGFASEEERDLFRVLIAVNGIGPKMAQTILSGIPPAELKSHIASGNSQALTAIPGVGRKIAERLVLELRERVGKLDSSAISRTGPLDEPSRVRSEALMALISLGYNRVTAEKAVRNALQESKNGHASVEELIKAALRHAAA
ncbi:MAG TPA: Holliday junction branch migration protein RuvA [Bacteroidota bacterium]|nr:Holliday junction branch migration protein RuvA [Bacteroidota bacterium]